MPVPQRRRDLPAPLASVIARATDPMPERRHESASAMAAAVAAAAARGRRALWSAVAAVAPLLALAPSTVPALCGTRPAQRDALRPGLPLVGAFDNATGDHRLDEGLVQVAFAQELMQSRAVTIVPRRAD